MEMDKNNPNLKVTDTNTSDSEKPELRFGFKDDPYELNAKDILDLVHQEIHCEHSLISHRMTWYVTSQSFLMASFTIAAVNSVTPNAHTRLFWLAIFIPILGILSSGIVLVSLYAAIASMHKLKLKENEILEGMDSYIPFSKIRGDISKSYDFNLFDYIKSFRTIHVRGMLPPMLFPSLFILSWIFLLIGVLIP
jgi:hypothetical protein